MNSFEEFNERMEHYLVEQTGLPRDTIKMVLDAQARFYSEHRGNIEAARDLLDPSKPDDRAGE